MNTNVVRFVPRESSYAEGAAFGKLTVDINQNYHSAYASAVSGMFFYSRPMDFLRGFMEAYRIEKEKKEFS